MTAEMGESLCYSWLKHIKRCQVVQTNWKTSFNWIHEELNLDVLQEAETWFENKYQFVKDKNNTYKTTECDVLGVQFKKSIHKVFAVEVAFHRDGLHYKNNIQTVISKCLRIAICLRACFVKDTQIEIFFATPRLLQDDDLIILNKVFEILNENYNSSIDDKIHFTLLTEDSFKNRIIKPLLIKSYKIADNSELFLRSCQLLEAAGMELDTILDEEFLSDVEPISDIAWNYMVPILEKLKKRDNKDDINELLKIRQLGMGDWPVISETRDPQRYYVTPITIANKKYYLTNYWKKDNKEKLIKWIVDHSYVLKG